MFNQKTKRRNAYENDVNTRPNGLIALLLL
jgi:hypothetical protein